MSEPFDRLYAFDNLRACMMWLGIVLHSAMVYMEPSDPLSGSPQTSLLATSLFGWIHIFRMPVFFIMAGFFAMLLIDRRGLIGTLQNRALRLVVPFAVFWPILLIAINLIIMVHTQKSGVNSRGISFDIDHWIISTGHLWFPVLPHDYQSLHFTSFDPSSACCTKPYERVGVGSTKWSFTKGVGNHCFGYTERDPESILPAWDNEGRFFIRTHAQQHRLLHRLLFVWLLALP